MLLSRYGNVVDAEVLSELKNIKVWARTYWSEFLQKQPGSRIKIKCLS